MQSSGIRYRTASAASAWALLSGAFYACSGSTTNNYYYYGSDASTDASVANGSSSGSSGGSDGGNGSSGGSSGTAGGGSSGNDASGAITDASGPMTDASGPMTEAGSETGAANNGSSPFLWARMVPASGVLVAVDGAGNTALAGVGANGFNFGQGYVVPSSAMFSAILDTAGAPLSLSGVASGYSPTLSDIATTASGHIVLAGQSGCTSTGSTVIAQNYPCGPSNASCGSTATTSFASEYAPQTPALGSACDWSHDYGANFQTVPEWYAVATEPSGDVVLGGLGATIAPSLPPPSLLPYDAGTPADAGPPIPSWVTQYDGDGGLLWTVTTPQDVPRTAQHVAVDGSGNVYVLAYSGASDTALVKYDPNGNLLWARFFAVPVIAPPAVLLFEPTPVPHRAMTVDSSGNVAVAFDVSGPIDLGGVDGGSVPPAYDAGAPVWLLVASFDPSGQTRWSHTYPVAQDPNLIATATAPDLAPGSGGSIVVGGTYWATIDFGGGPLPASGQDLGDRNVYLAAFDTNGTLLWSRGLGKPHRNQLLHLAGNGKGAVSVTGSFSDEIDFGSVALEAEIADGQVATRTFVAGFTVP